MANRNFRAAAQGFGKYCPVKNELRIRKGGKTYRFICGEQELRVLATGKPEIVIPIASDAKVCEFQRTIALMIGEC